MGVEEDKEQQLDQHQDKHKDQAKRVYGVWLSEEDVPSEIKGTYKVSSVKPSLPPPDYGFVRSAKVIPLLSLSLCVCVCMCVPDKQTHTR